MRSESAARSNRTNAVRGAFCGLVSSVFAISLFIAFLGIGWSGPAWEPWPFAIMRRDALKLLGLGESGTPSAQYLGLILLVACLGAIFGARIGRGSDTVAGASASRLGKLLARALPWHAMMMVPIVAFVLRPKFGQISDVPGELEALVVAVAGASLMLLPFAGGPLIISAAILEGWTRPVGTSLTGFGQLRVRIFAFLAIALFSLVFGIGGACRLVMLR